MGAGSQHQPRIDRRVNSYQGGDQPQGTLTSPTFTITRDYINLLIGGGRHPHASGTETAVNLVVDGKVVRRATGRNSEHLRWVAWNVEDLIGETARIRAVDANSGGWGHTLLDQIMFADKPALSVAERSDWVDYGRDFYAAMSWENVPDDKRYMIAWMNNWQYADKIPTSPWRGSMTLPRQVSLRTINGEIRLVQQPVTRIRQLRTDTAYHLRDEVIEQGTTPLTDPAATGRTLEIVAEFEVNTAETFGIRVRTDEGEQTVIGYDDEKQEVFVDRTQSSQVNFDEDFPSVEHAPLKPRDGKVRLRIFVDRSSVEVFDGQGQVVITDRIFPSPDSQGVELFAKGGNVRLHKLDIWPLRSIWRHSSSATDTSTVNSGWAGPTASPPTRKAAEVAIITVLGEALVDVVRNDKDVPDHVRAVPGETSRSGWPASACPPPSRHAGR